MPTSISSRAVLDLAVQPASTRMRWAVCHVDASSDAIIFVPGAWTGAENNSWPGNLQTVYVCVETEPSGFGNSRDSTDATRTRQSLRNPNPIRISITRGPNFSLESGRVMPSSIFNFTLFFIRFEAFRDCRIQRNIIGSEISRPEAGRWRLMPVDCPAQELPNHDVLNFTGHENHPLEFFFPSKFSLSLYMCTKINQKITKEPQIYEIYMRFRKFLILKKILKYFIYYSTQWYMEKN